MYCLTIETATPLLVATTHSLVPHDKHANKHTFYTHGKKPKPRKVEYVAIWRNLAWVSVSREARLERTGPKRASFSVGQDIEEGRAGKTLSRTLRRYSARGDVSYGNT